MLYNKLNKYSNSGVYPFHMPGHKRVSICDDIPYNLDLTEINDFDNLHNPTGVIKQLEDAAAGAFQVKHAFLLVNGSTCGILSVIRAFTNYGDKVLLSRNCHKSVYNAIELCGLNPVYLMPETDMTYNIASSINAEDIKIALEENRDIKLIVITSPTYEGVVSDIKSISKIAKKYNVKLFVDESHGAHFPFSEKFPEEAVKCGADAAVVSLHKTLPSLTQTALILTNNDKHINSIYENLSIFETSSPSYILMSSIEKCIEYITLNKVVFEKYIKRLEFFSDKCKALKNIKVLCYGNDSINNHNFFDFDISKIVVSLRGTDLTGKNLANILREEFRIEVEMAHTDYVILITSISDTDYGFELLYNALMKIDKSIVFKATDNLPEFAFNKLPHKVFEPTQKNQFKGIFLQLKDAIGKVCLEYIWTYPPGIPLLVPGEQITEDLINKIYFLTENGIEVYSTKGNEKHIIYCCDF